MSQKLDALLQEISGDPASLERARGLLDDELKRSRPRGWRFDAVVLLAASWGIAALVGAGLWVAGATAAELLARHAGSFGLLFAVGAACAWAGVAPPGTARLGFATVIAFAGLIGLVVLRSVGVTAPSAQPEWLCTVTHLGAGVAPLGVALVMLKKSASHPLRAVLTGVAVGTCGALIGEVGCAQSWQHVLVFHLSAWLALVAACAVVERRLVRSSYAP